MSLVNMAVSQLLTPYNLQRRRAHSFVYNVAREDPVTPAQMLYTEIRNVQDGLKMQKGSPSHNPHLAILYAPSPRVLSAIDLMQFLKLKGNCVLTCVAG